MPTTRVQVANRCPFPGPEPTKNGREPRVRGSARPDTLSAHFRRGSEDGTHAGRRYELNTNPARPTAGTVTPGTQLWPRDPTLRSRVLIARCCLALALGSGAGCGGRVETGVGEDSAAAALDSSSTASLPADPDLLPDASALCAIESPRVPLPDRLVEASGVAVSRRHPGVLWVHNDSDNRPAVYAIDLTGRLVATVRLDAPRSDDLEDIAVGDCPAGDCLYVAAIGDNLHERHDRGFYRFPEPDLDARDAQQVEFFPVTYPTGPQDAEALFVLPGADVHIISKGRQGPVTHYRYGVPADAGVPRVLETMETMSSGIVQLPDAVTGAGNTPDGSIVVVRTYTRLRLYRPVDGRLQPIVNPDGFSLLELGEGQGEGVDIDADGLVVLVSERFLINPTPLLSTVRCDLARLPR